MCSINHSTQAPSSSNNYRHINCTAMFIQLYSCTCLSRFLPTAKFSSCLDLFACLSSKYSCLKLRPVHSLTGHFNFLENRLAVAEAPISTAGLLNSAHSSGEYTRDFFLFKSSHFLAVLYLTPHTPHDWLTQLQKKEFFRPHWIWK